MMGAVGLEPTRLLRSTDFHPPTAFAAAFNSFLSDGFENWTLPLPSPLR